MTKERKLAIEMWESVKAYIVDADKKGTLYDVEIHDAVVMLKGDFCEKHGLQWAADCWFCQYVSDCEQCPLGMGAHVDEDCADYYIVINDFTTTEQKIKACDNIINALKGKPSTQEQEK